MIWYISIKSLLNRKFSTFLCIFSIALSVALFLSVEKLRTATRDGFTNTISKTDLLVSAKGGPLNTLLYTIFHIGRPTNNILYQSYETIKNHRSVDWTIPISLGDSYKGHRVVGTNSSLFEHYRFRGDRKLEFASGKSDDGVFSVVLGSQVAKEFNHRVGDRIVLSHGVSNTMLHHEQTPFQVVGILKASATPFDKAVMVSLEGIEAMHTGWENGAPPLEAIEGEKFQKENLAPKQITSFLLKTKSRIHLLRLQRMIEQFSDEPLMAIIPALALQQLWETMSFIEVTLFIVNSCVLLVGLFGIIISLFSTLNERRREIAILRSMGTKSSQVFLLILTESFFLISSGVVLGILMSATGMLILSPILESKFSLSVPGFSFAFNEMLILLGITLIGSLSGLIPAVQAYRNSLHDGLQVQS